MTDIKQERRLSPRIRVNQDLQLLCPACGSEYTHLDAVQVAARREDALPGEITVNAISGLVSGSPAPAPAGNIAGIGRRHRIAITGWCEGCHTYFALVLTQHKGVTYTEIVPLAELCDCPGCTTERVRDRVVAEQGSPIEQQFWAACRRLKLPGTAHLVPQYTVPGTSFRLDFALVSEPQYQVPPGYPQLPRYKTGIELDGFATHSSTADIARDRRRQRALEARGWYIIRFGGAEVHHDADGCVRQAASLIRSRLEARS